MVIASIKPFISPCSTTSCWLAGTTAMTLALASNELWQMYGRCLQKALMELGRAHRPAHPRPLIFTQDGFIGRHGRLRI